MIVSELVENQNNPRGLYFKEQLHIRVKMTQKQYDRLMWYKEYSDLSTCISYFLEHDGVNNFGLSSENLMGLLTQEDIARAWLNPEEAIEIVPDMKWFVETKNTTSDYRFLKIEFENKSVYNKSLKMYATHFETQSQAESWVNPLTKVVKLPLEV